MGDRASVGWASALFVLTVAGCGAERSPAAPEAPAREAPAPEVPAVVEPVADPSTAPEPQGEPIDLLRSVPSAVAVSSVYEDRTSWLERLVDGDLESAWNSRSGDLAGAWIEVRVPAGVTVTSIELTAGFTRTGGRVDLFTGNHRVARVRVLRDGTRLGEHALDPSSRTLQTLPVQGPGGVYRIELLELVPGTRTDWREACVSELRVLGHPGAVPVRATTPALAVASLPGPGEPVEEDDEAVGPPGTAITGVQSLWIHYETELIDAQFSTGDPDVTDEEIEGLRGWRDEAYDRLARQLRAADPARADRFARRASQRPSSWEWSARRADFDEVAPALVALAGADPALLCAAATADLCVRLERTGELAAWEYESNDVSAGFFEGDEEMQDMARDSARAAEVAMQTMEALGALVDSCEDEPRVTSERVRELTDPEPSLVAAEWSALEAAAGRVLQRCGAAE